MKKILFLILGLAFLSSLSLAKEQPDTPITTKCTRVVDGNTIVISGGDRVRLIGIDTREVYQSGKLDKDAARTGTGKDKKTIQALGKQSSNYTKRVLEGNPIRLVFDPANIYINHRDKYGRLLAYVYLPGGTFFNAQIIKDGYAYAYTQFPFKYVDEFRRYEREARENHRGLWADKVFQ